MTLYIVRHGMAEDVARAGDSDAARALTDEGIENTRHMAQVLKALDLHLDHLYSSPLVRARQTADILAKGLEMHVEERTELGPGFDKSHVAALLAEGQPNADLMFVGHEPDLSALLHALTGGEVEVKKGSLARVDLQTLDPLRGTLVWMIAPKIWNALREK